MNTRITEEPATGASAAGRAATDPAAMRRSWRERGLHGGETLPEVLAANAGGSGTPVSFHGVAGVADHVTTVGELFEAAGRVAAGLRERGVGPGERVLVQLPNRVEASIAYVAVLLSGAQLVPCIHIYGPNEVRFILEQSGALMLIQPSEWKGLDFGARVPGYREVPTLEHVVVVGGPGPDGTVGWDELAVGSLTAPDVTDAPMPDPDEPALLIYTSGTTSAPKGVQHSHNSLLAELRSAPAVLGSGPDAVQLVSFPPGHIAGVTSVLGPFVHGRPTHYLDDWSPAKAVELIATHRVTATAGTPFHLAGILELGDVSEQLASLREFLIGAATVPRELVRRADAFGIGTFRCYGSTEHPTVTAGAAGDPAEVRAGTDGRPLPGVEVRILDAAGEDVPVGDDGEVVTRGPDQFVGYLDPGLDAEAFTTDRWFRTGDLGHLDDAGRLTITDRIKDVVIRSGETLSSAQIEQVLTGHPAVADGVVVPAPDDRYGEVAAAVVVVAPDCKLDLEEIRRHFRESGLARQKTPERLVVVDELPRTALGKVRKAELRARHFPRTTA